jgi:hypothetical protein
LNTTTEQLDIHDLEEALTTRERGNTCSTLIVEGALKDIKVSYWETLAVLLRHGGFPKDL